MSALIRCPECGRRFSPSSAGTTTLRCPYCSEVLDTDKMAEEEDRPRPRQRNERSTNTNTLLILGLVGAGVVVVVLCAGGIGVVWLVRTAASRMANFAPGFQELPEETEDYAQARQNFQTQLVRQGPAPQEWEHEQPPAGVREVPYLSGNLRLRAWVNAPPPDGQKRPAVLFLHGGFAFGAEDWEQSKPFRNAGFVVMTPTLRGENGLPGPYSMFYNEVEDVLAAADTLAKLPYVDNKRIYIAGHSVGGTLTMLAVLTSSRFRAAASFSGSPDQVLWSRSQPDVIPFDPSDQREFLMRSPLAYPRSFKCPLRIYYGNQEFLFSENSQKTANRAKKAGLDVEALSVPGDHLSMIGPAMRQAIAFFKTK